AQEINGRLGRGINIGNTFEALQSWQSSFVADDFKVAVSLANEKNIPVHVGEFGAYSRADMDSRVKWTRFLARWFEQHQFSWAYWEWNSGFGIYDPRTGQYQQRLVDALIKDPMP
ncbi:MAG: cellulase family glycosylhydrolase, partial [Proteiniphilum sp.]